MTSAKPQIIGAPRFEHLADGFGIGTSAPRLSWTTEGPDGWEQRSYEVEVLRNGRRKIAGPFTTSDQLLVPWPDYALAARERAVVRVRLHGNDGSSTPWSQPAAVEAGLFEPSDWSAELIGGRWAEETGADRRPSRIRRDFTAPANVVRARLYASAHGVFEAEINGVRVGDETLAPGWTTYSSRLRYRTYDITELIQAGENAIGVWLGDGWWRGRLGFNGGYRDLYGDDLSFIGQLELEDSTGRRTVIPSDDSWHAAPSPILFSGLYDGERYDQRLDQIGWSRPGFEGPGWSPVRSEPYTGVQLVAYEQPPVRCTEQVAPVTVDVGVDGRILLDFGQNLVGRLHLSVRGSAGDRITLRHAEVLQDGELYRRPLRLAAAEDVLILGDDQRTDWEPRFTIHGFRYAEITGWPGVFRAEDVRARVHHTDMRRTGWFESSDALLNRLHENVRWSMRGNFLDIPTDCPQRDERLGWTGDIQVFAPTASFLYESSGFLASWLKDLAAEQLEDGTVPWFVPRIPGGSTWDPPSPGAVWGDAAVLTPWTLYERFGDAEILRTQYASARAWVELIIGLAGENRLWQEGVQLGDWLDPAAPPDDPANARTDRYLVATAYLAHSTRHLGRIAKVLGLVEDAARYEQIADEVREAFVAEYVREDGTMTSDAQTAYSLAIVFELVRGEQAQRAGVRLAQLVIAAGNRIATGFAGTPLVTDALSRTGHVDTAYDLLLERQCPSWLYTVLQGGTTIWERWDSMLPDGSINPGDMTSFNHYALGAVADWMHREIAGIALLEPAYRRVLFAPQLGGGLTSASGRLESPFGSITSSWTVVNDLFTLVVSLPIGTSGVVRLPGGDEIEITSGRFEFTSTVPNRDITNVGSKSVGQGTAEGYGGSLS